METEAEGRPAAAVAVAASAGGVEALSGFVRALPADFPGAVLVVLHISPAGPSVLPRILARAGKLPVVHAGDGADLLPGVVVVAPPDQHLMVRDSHTELSHGPRQNGHRPSADALFRSTALAYGRRSAGIVLSGTMDDGSAGLRAIGRAHGLTIAQDPTEAAFPGMPSAAIAGANPAVVCRVADMADRLTTWMSQLHIPASVPTDRTTLDDPLASEEISGFTCPECGGTLWLDHWLGTERFRCRVGHSFSAQALMAGKRDVLESALWAAVVALEEKIDLSTRLLRRLERTARPAQLTRYREDIEATVGQAQHLRDLIVQLVNEEPLPTEDESHVDAAH